MVIRVKKVKLWDTDNLLIRRLFVCLFKLMENRKVKGGIKLRGMHRYILLTASFSAVIRVEKASLWNTNVAQLLRSFIYVFVSTRSRDVKKEAKNNNKKRHEKLVITAPYIMIVLVSVVGKGWRQLTVKILVLTGVVLMVVVKWLWWWTWEWLRKAGDTIVPSWWFL